MTKKELIDLLNCTDGNLTIDKVRWLQRTKGANLENLAHVKSGHPVIPHEYDTLTLNFASEFGHVKSSYELISREPVEILEEIKKATELFYGELIEFLNGTKNLPNNW